MNPTQSSRWLWLSLMLLAGTTLLGCDNDRVSNSDRDSDTEFVAADDDFADYREWTMIGESTGPSNLLGEAHKPDLVRRVYKKQLQAKADAKTGEYPTGAILLKEVLDGSAVVEITAMVKRGGEFNLANNRWEWFMLDPATRSIAGRGADLMGGMCAGCHSQALNPERGVDYVFKHPNDPFNR